MGQKLPIGDKGSVQITFDYGTESGCANLIINPYLGNVKLATEDAISEVQEEEWGDTAVDAVFKGTKASLEVPMTRSTLAQLAGVLPGVTLDTNKLTFGVKAGGCSMYEAAVALMLKPICDGVVSTDKSQWVRILKAYPYRAIELPFGRDDQRVHLVKFMLFPSQDSGYEGKLWEEGQNT